MRMWLLLAGVAGAVVWYRRRSRQGQQAGEESEPSSDGQQRALPAGSGQGASTEAITAAREAELGAASGGISTAATPGGGSTPARSPAAAPARQGTAAQPASSSTATSAATTGPDRPQGSSTAQPATGSSGVGASQAGARAEARSGEITPDDRALAQQVRDAIERISSHPYAIDTSEDGATVTLRGAVLRRELDRLLRAVLDVHGVRDVENRLEVYDSAEGVPAFERTRGR